MTATGCYQFRVTRNADLALNEDVEDLAKALKEAARNGKEVTAVIELRARFDEESNIAVANVLQEAGAVVVYGIVGYKTHAKMILVIKSSAKMYIVFSKN
ncbi:unnamed protein product [Oppiella nova]|uniref:Polyphosphate kinase C-terminal domain-containing protein n=1 Tax=Oppiella nova TaxID=334625 RepID=A0A7R9L9S6_9ACAR|nr:unnamed protein product [Oppiella nova]CAG2156870.1 unnamed protein product [Oppiella nova]